MKDFRLYNNIAGWGVFVIATLVYLVTIESTASFWDCGEFIAASYKMQVGHPPGAPLFLLFGRIFSLFAGGNAEFVPVMINALSALASSFTVLFLFWTISHLALKITGKKEVYTPSELIIVLGSALTGSLSYAFSDTFWFSAAEGEVYASSSLFTALVFWAILKWENVAGEKAANRWLVLIAYLMGLSIGVHLLNLLAIPAIVLIYYFKTYKISRRGVFYALVVAIAILASIMYVLLPGLVQLATWVERITVNTFGVPYWTGIIIFIIVLITCISIGIAQTHRKGKVLLNTIIVSVAVIILGYSSYAAIVIRSNANPPMDQNNPENMYNLLYYLNREQYGERPLIFGQHFNAPADYSDSEKPVYAPVNGKYQVVANKRKVNYDKRFQTLLPRMWSNSDNHIDAYLQWADIDEKQVFYAQTDNTGNYVTDEYNRIVYNRGRPKNKPSFGANLKFMLRYQFGHMYFRYFMWNFSGRQNDFQSHFKEEINKGNWLTGINKIDEFRLGPQKDLPRALSENKARNTYYAVPLILGLIGMLFQYSNNKKYFWVVMSLFIFTGLAIVAYLNQNPMQPRERDYAYAGSFYAFSIWIGLAANALFAKSVSIKGVLSRKFIINTLIVVGVIALFDIVPGKGLYFLPFALYVAGAIVALSLLMFYAGRAIKKELLKAALVLLICMASPLLLAFQNWDDHNRSGRYFARDMASNYLNSCEKNAILFTNGDNDTFPLWYAQEVEGIRTDVRVVNLSYLGADWYIEQMRQKAYSSEPLLFTLPQQKYRQGKRDVVYLIERLKRPVSVQEAINFVGHDEDEFKTIPGIAEKIDYIPQKRFVLEADSALVHSNGTINEINADKYVPRIEFTIGRNLVTKNHVAVLDLLATNNWERPVYFAISVSSDNYIGLQDYFEMAGMTYRIVPALMKDSIFYFGGINPVLAYDRLMNKFVYGNIGDSTLFYDENVTGMLQNLRNNFNVTAKALLRNNQPEKALEVLQRSEKLFNNKIVPFDILSIAMAEAYYEAGKPDLARRVIDKIYANNMRELEYYKKLKGRFAFYLDYEKRLALHVLNELARLLYENGEQETGIKFAQELQQIVPALSIKKQ